MLSLDSPQLELFSVSPALFVENQGQWADESVRFLHQGNGANVAMTEAGPVFQVLRHDTSEDADSQERRSVITGLDVQADGFDDRIFCEPDGPFAPDPYVTEVLVFSASFVDATAVTPVGLEPSEAVFNYFVGDQSAWRTDVPAYEKVVYKGIYDGIDLQTWGLRSSLKYEFHVAPGADFTQIQVRYDGIEGLQVNEDGSLRVALGEEWGELVDDAPYIYQMIHGDKVEVAGRFLLLDQWTYTFEVTGTFDPTQPLVIDPDLAWSTYLGGSDLELGNGIAVDGSGNVYVTGSTSSAGWVQGGFDTSYDGSGDAFVVKLSPSGEHLWSTYLGGSDLDSAESIAVDSAGNIYVTGRTTSSGWTSGGFDTSFNGAGDAFVVKLSASGQHLWSTYLGGSDWEFGAGIAVDQVVGDVYVTGGTGSSGWVSGGFDAGYNGNGDAFVAKLTASGHFLWGTYLGGSNLDYAEGVAIFGDHVFVTGTTYSAGWTSGGFDTSHGGGGSADAFVADLSPSGDHFWSTYLGGSEMDQGSDLVVNSAEGVYVTGETASVGWTSGGYDTSHSGYSDAFVVKLSLWGQHSWSTYMGGTPGPCVQSSGGAGRGIAVDETGNVYVTGSTDSPDWTSGGFDRILDGCSDAFVVKLSAWGEHVWSSYLGGSGWDEGSSIAVDSAGNMYVTGVTDSPDFPNRINAYQGGYRDAFVAKISESSVQNALPMVAGLTANPNPVTRPGLITLTATGVSDPDGTVTRVEFYRGNVLLGSDQDGSNGWSYTGATTGWDLGQHWFSARAQDNDGAWSAMVSTTATVSPPASNWADLVAGVSQVVWPGTPGPVYDTSGDWTPIVGGDEDTSFPSTVAMARQYGAGRVVAFGHPGIFSAVDTLDNGPFLENVTRWLDAGGSRQVKYTTHHREVVPENDFVRLGGRMIDEGYRFASLSDVITTDNLATTSVLLVGSASLDFTADEVEIVRHFVERGGGLWLVGLGWSWEPYNPGKTLEDYPMMQLAEPYSMRWLRSYIGDPTNDYGGSMVFHTFYPEVPSISVSTALQTIRAAHAAHPQDLPAALESNTSLRLAFTQAHQALSIPTYEFPEGHTGRRDLYEALIALAADFPESYSKGLSFDQVAYPTATWVRERFWQTWRDCLPLTSQITATMIDIGQLGEGYAAVLQDHGVILLDNLRLGTAQVDFIHRYLDAIPVGLHSLRRISVVDYLGTRPAPISLYGGPDGVNVFGLAIGDSTENPFPGDVAPTVADIFVSVVAHEVNHVVHSNTIGGSKRLSARRDHLIADAGNEPMNYLRSMITPGFFVQNPQEFFASIANQWFSDSAHAIALGLARFDADYRDPINQALYFADVYSQGENYTWFYRIDATGSILRTQALLGRDLQGRINELTVDNKTYSFELDQDGDVLGYFVEGNQPPGIGELVAEPSVVARPGTITLRADGVSDADGQVTRVEFYRGQGFLGADTDGSDGWSWSGGTADWAFGAQGFAARAQDDDGAWSPWVDAVAWVGDRFEVNNAWQTATDFGLVTQSQAEPNLNLHSGTDVDWFRFTLAHPGDIGSRIEVAINKAGFGINAVLYSDSAGAPTPSSIPFTMGFCNLSAVGSCVGTLSLYGLPAGTYYVEVLPNIPDPDTVTGFYNSYDLSIFPPTEEAINWARYLGGGADDSGRNIAVDGAGNVYVTGSTSSAGWVQGGFDTSYDGSGDAFVVKLSPSGEHLWSTYLGGSGIDGGRDIALDGAGNVYVIGSTGSAGWISGGFDTSYDGGYSDGFVVKLSPVGQHLWSTYLGGSGWDEGNAIVVSGWGTVYVAGSTASSGWISGGFDATFNGDGDAFVVSLNPLGQHLWSTYLGGTAGDFGQGVAVFGDYVLATGSTSSTGWTIGGFDTSYNGGTSDAFVVALAPFGSHVWSTYLGGSEWDAGFDLVGVVESDWETSGIYVTGGTNSAGWASGGYDTGHSGYSDAFVVKLSLEGQHLWSTYLGGAPLPGGQGSGGFGRGVAADGIGGVYLTGFSDSPDWVDGGFDTTLDGDRDAFVVKINASGEHVWSSYLGGSGWDDGFGIAVGSAGDMYVAGMTDSPDFPWHINTQQGANDAFVAKLRRSNGTLHAATVNSTLTITDIAQNGISNQLTVMRSGANLVLSDATERFVSAPAGGVLSPDERTLTIPLTLVTAIVVDLAGGNDLLTVDFSDGDPIPVGGLSYDGGDGADELTVLGGTFSAIVKAFDNASDGSLDLDDTSLSYVRLESVRIGVASVDDLVLNLPISPDSASLEDDGTTGNDFSRLRSTNAGFVNTAFVNPTGSLTVNPGQPDDTITVADLPDFDAGLSIGSEGSLFGAVTFAGAVRLAPNRNLLAYASGTIALSTGSSDLAVSAAGGITLTTERNVVLAGGSSITTSDGDITIASNQQATPTTGGAFTGISLTGAAISTTGTGRIGLAGRGGTSGGGNNGIYVAAGSVVSGGTTGAVTIRGMGGASTGDQNYGVLITDSGSLITSKTGALLVEGTGGGVGSSGENYGVLVQQRAIISSSDTLGAAGVTVKGFGGNPSGTGGTNTGVYLLFDSHVTASSGAVLVEGIGGGGAISSNNRGVEFVQGGRVTSTGTAASATVTVRGVGSNKGRTANSFGVAVGSRSLITSNGGAVLVEGIGGGLPGELGAYNFGVFVWGGGAITSAGTESSANVTVKGSGGNTGGGISENYGVYVRDANSQITSNGGAVLVEGTGGGAGNGSDNHGVVVANGIITSAATRAGATVTVKGFGGNLAGTGGSNHGVRVANADSRIASSGGNMHVVGTAGGGASSFGIRVESDGQITGTTGAPTITLTADSMTLLSSASINATSGAVVLQPYHAGTQIDLGGDDVLSGSQPTLGLTREELGRVAAAALTIGNATSDTIRLTGAMARAMATDVSLISGGAIVFDTGSFDTAGGDLLLVPGVGGVQPLTVNRDVTVDNLSFGSGAKLAVHINGTTVDGGYSQLNLAGMVDLTGVLLTLSGTYTPTVGDSFTIVNNDGSDPVLGTFMGLPEGATILNFLGSGLSATISYVAGDGNDVVLEVGLEQGNQLPLVDMLTVVPDPIIRPDQITLTAEGVTDIDGQIVQVEFYRGQQLLGMDQNGGDGWTWTESTANWPLGEHTIFVRAQDNDGDWSEMALAMATVYGPYTPIEFGPVPVFASRQQTFTVHNSGTSSMTIQPTMLAPPVSISLPNGSGNSDDWLIGAGATKSFLVTFAPTQDGPVEAALMLLSDDPSEGDYLAIITGLAVDGWRNVTEPYDVDGNCDVTPLDVLLLINEINSNGSRMLTPRTAEKPGLPLFLDPTGDGSLTPGDVLAIINQINQRGMGVPEGEAVPFEGNVWSAGLVSGLDLHVASDRGATTPLTEELTRQTIVRRTAPERKSTGTTLASRSLPDEPEGWLAGLPPLGERSTLNPFELEELLSDLLSPEESSVDQGRIV